MLPSIILRRKHMQTHVSKVVQGGIWTFPQWLRIFETKDSTLPLITLREKYMQTSVPTMVQGGRGFAHKLYVYVMTLGTKMVVDHLLWDPGPMNVVIRRHKSYLAKKNPKRQTVQIMLAVLFSGNT